MHEDTYVLPKLIAIVAATILAIASAVVMHAGDAIELPLAGECLGVRAYATVGGTTVGPTTKTCLYETDCATLLTVGPQDSNLGVATAHYTVWVPWPTNPDPSCSL